ncbi:YwqI/YxiC family protein [Peribacillus deserti]|uniref:TIGR04197 family type VII secretion effector n=1 Tax=Peribacillus deserti TaxID=673318 RepID=A0A2N5M8V2_9BACI|nr:YwqI/YxiC family protein [Peribacillus deserti]PLT30786.1 hypothetical protein CUU66_06440 [Peribacillus deserti]
MSEIKINYSGVDQVLANMQGAANSLDPVLPQSVAENNKLDAVNALLEINQLFEQVLQNYKSLLLKNESMTKKSVEVMKETDEQLSSSFGHVPMR